MASDRTNTRHPIGKIWLARVQHLHKRRNLGYFETQEEAEEKEDDFRRSHNIVKKAKA